MLSDTLDLGAAVNQVLKNENIFSNAKKAKKDLDRQRKQIENIYYWIDRAAKGKKYDVPKDDLKEFMVANADIIAIIVGVPITALVLVVNYLCKKCSKTKKDNKVEKVD